MVKLEKKKITQEYLQELHSLSILTGFVAWSVATRGCYDGADQTSPHQDAEVVLAAQKAGKPTVCNILHIQMRKSHVTHEACLV